MESLRTIVVSPVLLRLAISNAGAQDFVSLSGAISAPTAPARLVVNNPLWLTSTTKGQMRGEHRYSDWVEIWTAVPSTLVNLKPVNSSANVLTRSWSMAMATSSPSLMPASASVRQ